MKRTASSEEEMIALGRETGAELAAGDLIALAGELGAGKTHFCKGLALGLEIQEAVTSPTFALVNEYRTGRLPMFHFDFYRIESVGELEEIGWEEYLDGSEGVVVVEWADKFSECIPEHARWLFFQVNRDGTHEVTE